MARSNRFRAILLAILFALAVPVVAQDDEPVYGGIKASVWIDTLNNDASARKRVAAVAALGRIWMDKAHEEALKSIARAVKLDTSAAVRLNAAALLGQLKVEQSPMVASDLEEAAKNEKTSRVRRELAVALGRFPEIGKKSTEPLTGYLKDPDPATRSAAADALGRAGSAAKAAAPVLLTLLTDPDKSVRQAAVFGLGRVGPDPEVGVPAALVKMLAQEKDADLKRELIASLDVLGDRSPPVVEAIAAFLTSTDFDLKQQSARALGTFGSDAALASDRLLKLASTPSEPKSLRVDAVRAFGSSLGGGLKTRCHDLLPIMENDPDFEVRIAAIEEIAVLGFDLKDDKVVIAALRKRLADPQVKVRETARSAVEKIEKGKKPVEKEPGKP